MTDDDKTTKGILNEGYKAPIKNPTNTVLTKGYKAPKATKVGGKPPSFGSVVKPKKDS